MSPEIEVKLYELLKRVPYTSNEYPGLEFFYSNVADIPTHLDPVFGKVDISLLPKNSERSTPIYYNIFPMTCY